MGSGEPHFWGDLQKFTELCVNLGIQQPQIDRLLQCHAFYLPHFPYGANLLAFADDEKHLTLALRSTNVRVILVSADLATSHDGRILPTSRPKYVFWTLVEYQHRQPRSLQPTMIASSAVIAAGATVDPYGCRIGHRTRIEHGAVICKGTVIGDDCSIGPGTVIGSDGLEIKDTLFGWIRISHEAGVQIHNRVVIGANCTINRGLLGNDTIIQQETMIDSGVHIAHACQIGQRNTITAHATLGGSVVTGNEVFIGLNATIVNAVTICDAAFIGAGAIVARSISEPVRVLPYPSKTLPN